MRRVLLAGAACAALAGCGQSAGAGGHAAARVSPARVSPASVPATPSRATLLVSGRDDHGLLAERLIALRTAPDGLQASVKIPSGTLVRAEAELGEWIRVRALEGRPVRGWLDDFYLRDVVHVARRDGCAARLAPRPGAAGHRRVPRNGQARIVAAASRHGSLWVQVRLLRGGVGGWVPRGAVRELPRSRDCVARS